MMTKAAKLNVAQIDVLRAETLNQLDLARAHLDEMAYAAALPGGDEKAMLKARDAVQSYELKVGGLATARKAAEAEEEREREEAAAAARRQQAIKVRIAASEHSASLMGLSAALSELRSQIATADATADRLRRYAFGLTDHQQGHDTAANALVALGAFGQGDVPFLVKKATKETPDLFPYLVGASERAIAILSTILPEINDEAVIAEAESNLDEKALAQYKATAEAAVAKGKEMGAALAEIGGR